MWRYSLNDCMYMGIMTFLVILASPLILLFVPFAVVGWLVLRIMDWFNE